MTIFIVFIVLGLALAAVGAAISEFWIIIVGRAIYGLGGDSLFVAELAFLAEYFSGNGMGLAVVNSYNCV